MTRCRWAQCIHGMAQATLDPICKYWVINFKCNVYENQSEPCISYIFIFFFWRMRCEERVPHPFQPCVEAELSNNSFRARRYCAVPPWALVLWNPVLWVLVNMQFLLTSSSFFVFWNLNAFGLNSMKAAWLKDSLGGTAWWPPCVDRALFLVTILVAVVLLFWGKSLKVNFKLLWLICFRGILLKGKWDHSELCNDPLCISWKWMIRMWSFHWRCQHFV